MTKLTKILALLALLAAPVFAQEPPPGIKPEIKGPSLALPGQELRLNATGLTTPPLTEGIGKLQEWSTKVHLIIDGPEGVDVGGVADTDLSLGLGAQSVKFRIFFTPPSGGTYVLVLHDANAGTVITKRIVVGPVVPKPDPLVPPTPVVSGRRVIFLVREAKEVTPQFNRTELDLTTGESWKTLRQKKHDLLILSDDRGIPSNYPATAQAAFQKAKGLTMPSIAILDPDSWAELYVGAVDKNAKPEDIMALIQKYGG